MSKRHNRPAKLHNNGNDKPELSVPIDLPFDVKEGEVTREDVAERVAQIPKEDLYITDDELAVPKFKPNPDLDPHNPDDMEAINEEARAFMENVIKPMNEQSEVDGEAKYQEIIETEADFLKHFKPKSNDLQIIHEGALVTFHVKPLEPTDDFSKLQVDSSVFSDIDAPTRNAIMKQGKGIPLSPREQKMIDSINKGTKNTMASKGLEMANSLLTQFVTPPAFNEIEDKEQRMKARAAFWDTQNYSFKVFLSNAVSEILGLNVETHFKIFRPS